MYASAKLVGLRIKSLPLKPIFLPIILKVYMECPHMIGIVSVNFYAKILKTEKVFKKIIKS